MPDPTDAPIAASSAAPDATPAPVVDALDALNETDLHAWRMTGKLPAATPDPTSTAASSAAAPVEDQAVSTDTPTEPASEVGTPRADPRATENRIPELLADRAKERTRAERAERRVAELEAGRSAPPAPETRPAASSAAPPASGLVKPNPDDFPYGTVDDGYLDALTDFKVATTLAAERAKTAEADREVRTREQQQRKEDAFNERADKARARHADFNAVAMDAPTEIPQGSPVDLFILEDEHGPEILYHLQKPENADERRRILKLEPLAQLKACARLGDALTAGDPPARSTSAPPPPPTLTTRATAADPVERALAIPGDAGTRAYIDAENRRELARLKR